MMKRIVLSFLILLVVVSACKEEKPKSPVVLSLSSFPELVHPAYLINSGSICQYVRVNLSNANDTIFWDSASAMVSCLTNQERARWQYKPEKGAKYMIGNIAALKKYNIQNTITL